MNNTPSTPSDSTPTQAASDRFCDGSARGSHPTCIISATFPPDICGVGDYTCQLARALGEQGERVTVLTGQHEARPCIEEVAEGVTVKRILPGWTWKSLVRILQEVQSEGYKLVHIQYTPQFYGRHAWVVSLLPVWLTLGTQCRTLVTFHEIYTPYLPGLRHLIAGTYHRLIDTILLWSSAAAIVTVENRMHRLTRLFPWMRRSVYTIPVGSGLAMMKGQSTDERLAQRASFGIAPDELVIGTFGALHTDKRYESLFTAIRRLLDKGDRVQVVMIGAITASHPYYKQLKKCIADLGLTRYITWTDFGTPSEVSRWLETLDLYVMTDLRGASDRKSSLITALAYGLPIVATRGPDTSDNFVDGENIVLVDVADETALVKQIHRLLGAPEERSRLRAGARRLYDSVYGWERIAHRTREVYQRYESRIQG